MQEKNYTDNLDVVVIEVYIPKMRSIQSFCEHFHEWLLDIMHGMIIIST